MDLALLLPAKDEKNLNDYFKKEAKKYLDKGVTVNFDSTLKNGFQLGPKDGSYKVSFTEEDFINFFKHYLRPKLVEILFSAE
jgi:V/A-type H+-transporting ATPase subunit E